MRAASTLQPEAVMVQCLDVDSRTRECACACVCVWEDDPKGNMGLSPAVLLLIAILFVLTFAPCTTCASA